MYNKYFGGTTFQNAMDLLETDPLNAEKRLKDYIEKYPKDFYGRAYYALTLTRLCKFNEAEIEYENIKLESQANKFYMTNFKNLNGFKYTMLIVKLKILAWHEKYQEMLDLAMNYYDLFEPNDVKYIIYYCKIKLNLIGSDLTGCEPYRFMQAYNYSDELFRDHIKKHMSEYNKDIDNPNSFVFEDDFPLDRVIEEVKKNIPSDLRTFPGYFDNTYYFKYKHCGKVDGEWSDMFAVIAFHNTNNLITMCPVIGYDKIPAKDLNNLRYEIEPKEEEKVKRLSQIDKFNRRFNRN